VRRLRQRLALRLRRLRQRLALRVRRLRERLTLRLKGLLKRWKLRLRGLRTLPNPRLKALSKSETVLSERVRRSSSSISFSLSQLSVLFDFPPVEEPSEVSPLGGCFSGAIAPNGAVTMAQGRKRTDRG
jgi:hypothetical protein